MWWAWAILEVCQSVGWRDLGVISDVLVVLVDETSLGEP